MDAYQAILARATRRLEVDPELQLDVANELRTHLADSAAEFHAAGLDERQAAEKACKALGDPDELAEQLWKANRFRLTIRGIFRWAARVALIPVAFLVVLSIVLGLRGTYLSFGLFSLEGWPQPLEEQDLQRLSEEQRFIFRGDPSAQSKLEADKSIADRWPDNPIYYGNYVTRLIVDGPFRDSKKRMKAERLDELLAILHKGEHIDPENAFYNYTKAAWLICAAAKVTEDTSRTYQQTNRRGEVKQKTCSKIEIHDPEKFQRGLAEFRRGVEKPEVSPRVFEMASLRLKLLPKPRRLTEYLRRLALEVSTLLPSLQQYKEPARALSAHAISLAQAGQAEQAVELARAVETMGAQIGARAHCIIELLVGQAIYVHAMAHIEQVYKELGRADEATEARAALEVQRGLFNEARSKFGKFDKDKMRHASFLWRMLLPSGYTGPINFEPTRSAEQAVAAQLALLGLLAVTILLMALLGGLTVWDLLLRRKRPESRGILVFVGWRRIGMICLLAIALPLAVYAFYAYLLTAGDRTYGLSYTLGKTALEFAVTAAAMVVLLLSLSYSAVRARAAEIGISAPPAIGWRDRRWTAALGVLVGLVVVVYLVGWSAGPFKPAVAKHWSPQSTPGTWLAMMVGAFLLLWAFREFLGLYLQNPRVRFQRTLYRSLVPILTASVIVMGVLCGWALARLERSAVNRIEGTAEFRFADEVKRSVFLPVQQRLVQQYEARTSERP